MMLVRKLHAMISWRSEGSGTCRRVRSCIFRRTVHDRDLHADLQPPSALALVPQLFRASDIRMLALHPAPWRAAVANASPFIGMSSACMATAVCVFVFWSCQSVRCDQRSAFAELDHVPLIEGLSAWHRQCPERSDVLSITGVSARCHLTKDGPLCTVRPLHMLLRRR
jgi:hypothetical protein